MADALDKKCDTVLTCGGIQSNHCRATAVAARELGLNSCLFLRHRQQVRSRKNTITLEYLGKWFEPRGISYWFVVNVRVKVVFRKTVVGD